MTLKIKNNAEEIVIAYNKKSLTVNKKDSSKNSDWNTKGINTFLIELVSAMEDGDKLEVTPEEKDSKDDVYNHVVELFVVFANEYNKMDN